MKSSETPGECAAHLSNVHIRLCGRLHVDEPVLRGVGLRLLRRHLRRNTARNADEQSAQMSSPDVAQHAEVAPTTLRGKSSF